MATRGEKRFNNANYKEPTFKPYKSIKKELLSLNDDPAYKFKDSFLGRGRFTFQSGKYKGELMIDIINSDKSYIDWYIDTYEKVKSNPYVHIIKEFLTAIEIIIY